MRQSSQTANVRLLRYNGKYFLVRPPASLLEDRDTLHIDAYRFVNNLMVNCVGNDARPGIQRYKAMEDGARSTFVLYVFTATTQGGQAWMNGESSTLDCGEGRREREPTACDMRMAIT